MLELDPILYIYNVLLSLFIHFFYIIKFLAFASHGILLKELEAHCLG